VTASKPATTTKAAIPPAAPMRPSARTFHGVEIADEYAWLRDANWREVMRDPFRFDTEIRAYLVSENEYG
jgi:oligopeptidase B